MEQLFAQLAREFRAFRQHAEDRIQALERSLRLVSPEPVVVPEEPETPATDAGATSPETPPATSPATDATGGATDPVADAKGKAKGKASDQPADQTDPVKETGA